MTSSTAAGSIPERFTASRTAIAPSCGARSVESPPRYFPIGVRVGDTITGVRSPFLLISSSLNRRARSHPEPRSGEGSAERWQQKGANQWLPKKVSQRPQPSSSDACLDWQILPPHFVRGQEDRLRLVLYKKKTTSPIPETGSPPPPFAVPGDRERTR